MHIAMHCGGMPFDGETIPAGKSLGGSESAAYYMARELVNLGHRVVLFTNSQRTGRWDGVIYEWAGTVSPENPLGDRFHFVMQAPHDVVIVQRHPAAFLQNYNSKLNLWWLHDLALGRLAGTVAQQLWNIDRILTVSEFHRRQVAAVYGIDADYITATANGVDYAAFEGLRDFDAGARRPRSLVYAARPERGLENLVGADGIMEQLPDCHLYVCGYDNTTEPMRAFYEYLWRRCEELPNVTNLGPLGKRALYDLLADSMLYIYPTNFEDTSCIMVLEANAAGTPFIGCAHAALPETAAGGGARLLPLADGNVAKKSFVKTVRRILQNPQQWDRLHQKALGKRQSWAGAAAQWEVLFADLLAEKCRETRRLARHLERTSDITALMELGGGDADEVEKLVPDFKTNYRFMLKDDYAGHYERYYRYEKERGVVYGPENLTGNSRFEQTAHLVGQINPRRVLDFGCAHGHYVMNLLQRFPQLEITGVDLNRSNIEIARKWAESIGPISPPIGPVTPAMQAPAQTPCKPRFICGDHTAVEGQFDLIIAAEVLEHVPDPGALVNALMAHLAPAGTMLITVPYGPWEAIGYAQHPGWRAHIHHLERADLAELFGGQADYRIMAVPHHGHFGHFIATFKASGKPCGAIDYGRKLAQQAPRETLAVAVIVKDGEHTLGRTLQSVAGLADEIIVGIDKTTTDETWRVALDFGALAFEIDSPLTTGFAAARNTVISQAGGDWILWIDTDETLEGPEKLVKYLRANCLAGYAVKQHHFAGEPAGLIKTDLPCRIFRNGRGIQFYGEVHEHPEKTLNGGMGQVLVLPDIAIMHTGYATEAVRRKRFERNWPLMQRDRQRNPERLLGIFLWLRDLAHMISYTMEGNGGGITREVQQMAEEGVAHWRRLVEKKHLRMAAEGLPYYSQCVQVLKNGGAIEYKLSAAARKAGMHSDLPLPELTGLFMDSADIRKLTGLVLDDLTGNYEKKYF